jgi:CRISPR-associated protein Cas1
MAQASDFGFRRTPGRKLAQTPVDVVNGFLDHGNYLAYVYASVPLHGLRISFAFPVLRGKTRRVRWCLMSPI